MLTIAAALVIGLVAGGTTTADATVTNSTLETYSWDGSTYVQNTQFYQDEGIYVRAVTSQSGGYLCLKKFTYGRLLPCGTQPQTLPWLLGGAYVPVVEPGSRPPAYYQVDAYDTNPLKRGATVKVATDNFYISTAGCGGNAVCAEDALNRFRKESCSMANASLSAAALLFLMVAGGSVAAGFMTVGSASVPLTLVVVGAAAVAGINATDPSRRIALAAHSYWWKLCHPPVTGSTASGASDVSAAGSGAPDYTVVAQPTFDPITTLPADPTQAAAVQAWVNHLAFLRVVDTTITRLEAAQAAGDQTSALQQWQALGTYATQLGDAVDQTATTSADLADQLAASSTADAPATAQDISAATTNRDRIVQTGFTAAETSQLHQQGLTDAELAAARTDLATEAALLAANQRPSELLAASAGDLGLEGGWSTDMGAAFATVPTDVTANPDTATTDQGQPVAIAPLANDTAADGASLAITGADASSAHGGTVSCDPSTCTYGPPAGFAGTDTFTYTVGSTSGANASATVTVTVVAVAPTATDDVAATSADAPIDIDVLSNDAGPPGSTLMITAADATSAHGGTISCAAPAGPCTFTPNPAFAGDDTFHYTITTEAGLSATATVTVSVAGAPYGDPPIANDDHVTGVEASVKGLNVLSNDTAPAGMTLHLQSFDPTTPGGGTVSCGPGGNCFYTPDPGFLGIDSFGYVAVTTGNRTAAGTAYVDVVAKPPTATADSENATTGVQVSFNVLSNDIAPGVSSLQLVSSDAVSAHGGVVLCDPTGACTYQVEQPFGGDDTFSYVVASTAGTTATGVVTVHVTRPANGPPTVQADTLETDGPNVLDVLANDSDPDLDPLHIIGSSAPAHGTASCGALGGCLYRPSAGYVGADAFTYTVSDGRGATTVGTVDVTVDAPVAIDHAPVAGPDVLGTDVGTSATVDVLANDTDADHDALTVTATGTPRNGTADCTAEGLCTYTPADGFSGFDGFTYVVADPSGASTNGVVLVRVAPSGTQVKPSATGHDGAGGSGPVVPGAQATWTVAGLLDPASTPQELAANALPASIQVTLSGDQALDPATVKLAPGWSFDAATKVLTVAPTALAGSSVVDLLGAPTPPISQGGGGDGHVPILVGDRMYAVFHHAYPTAITCIDRKANQECAGYPKPIPLGSSNLPGPAAVVGTKFYVHLYPQAANAQSAAIALFCWDTATDATCGLNVLDRYPTSGVPEGSAPVVVGDKIVETADTGKLYCVVAATMLPCAIPSVATGLGVAFDAYYDITTHGSLAYVSRGDTNEVSCIDVSMMALCNGWQVGARNLGGGFDLITRHDASGKASGICVATGTLVCVNDGAPDAMTTYGGWPGVEFYGTATEEAETGTRTIIGLSSDVSGVGCWDWTTNAACAGGGYVDGRLSTDTDGNPLPPAYGAAWDGSCVVAVGDAGLAFTMDPVGTSPCSPLQVGASRVIDLRDQRWDQTVGTATWSDVEVRDANLARGGDFTSLVITVKDAGSGTVLRTEELVGSNGIVDLSGVSATLHPALTVTGSSASSVGAPAWQDGDPPKLVLSWHPDAAQVTFKTTTPTCADGHPLGLTATLVGRATQATATLPATAGVCPPVATAVAASVIPGGSVPVTLTASSPTGKPLTYRVVSGPGHGTVGAVAGTTVTYQPAAGFSGTDTFSYVANDGSVDSSSALVTITVAATVPGPPIQVSAIGGNANATVRWLPPLSDGGAAITHYEITATPGGEVVTVAGDQRQVIVPGLANGTAYVFHVRAQNAKGWGAPSDATNAAEPRSGCVTDAFLDVTSNHPFCPEITWMANHGIAKGYPDGNYRPDANVTRQAMAAFVYRLAGAELGPHPTCTTPPFPDVAITQQFCGEIAWLKAKGITNGFPDGTFQPQGVISRQAMAAFLYRLSGSPRGAHPTCDLAVFTDVPIGQPFCGEIDWMVDSGLASGFPDGRFQTSSPISRQAMAAFLFRYNVLTHIVGS